MHLTKIHIAPTLLLALALTACGYPKPEGEALRKEVDALKKELVDNRAKAKDERAKLQQVMEQVTSLLTRNNADVGAQVERMDAKLAKTVGQMETAVDKVNKFQTKFDAFKAKVDVKLEGLSGQTAGNKNAPVPKDKDQLFKMAQSKFAATDLQAARRLLRHFMQRFASDTRVGAGQQRGDLTPSPHHSPTIRSTLCILLQGRGQGQGQGFRCCFPYKCLLYWGDRQTRR